MNLKEYKERYPDFDKVLKGRKMTLKPPKRRKNIEIPRIRRPR